MKFRSDAAAQLNSMLEPIKGQVSGISSEGVPMRTSYEKPSKQQREDVSVRRTPPGANQASGVPKGASSMISVSV